ncbi:succinylglutamate desuccinylase/aspartoacylase domain-containing protein, partial [Achromobacter denitrificans]|uniref:succinylglutamate desuccinylase/aspartoacylase domain-containing protein n=1 Tax=Achromobacter denitrificans TaxID=32002 RepID=UPI0023E87F8F
MATVSREDFSCAAATNESAYRRVTVPVLKIEAGPGPAVALIAGVHGDEWEGQAAILDLWHQLPGILQRGTVYLLPAVNAEASLAGTRLSPADGGNLNRAFLGAPARGYTESVAAALEARLLPRIQAMVDVHSGGASLRYLPSSVITRYGDDAYDARLPALARAFGLPQCVFFRGNEAGSMPAAASRHGILRLSAEIGGGRETSGSLVERCREGLLGCLGELGLLPARPLARDAEVRLYDLDAPAATLRAREPGVFISDVELGQSVAARQQIGRLIEPARPDTPARVLASPQAGTVVCLR